MKIIPDRASHWYYPSGVPCHQVQAKSGKGLRDTTLRDARELGLLPSITTILKVLNKPELENWKQEQCILAALTLPRLENEPLEAFARRVVEDSQAQASEAADFGRGIHKQVENWLTGSLPLSIPEIDPFLESFVHWAKTEIEEVYATEGIVVNHHEGYAGTFDIHCRLRGIGDAVCDIKTQGLKNGKPTFHDEWGYQLAAYGAAISRTKDKTTGTSLLHAVPEMPALVSIVINSREPGPIFCHQWEERSKLWFLFKCAYELWKHQKNYEPKIS